MPALCCQGMEKELYIFAMLAYIRHFIFAVCYDNDPWVFKFSIAFRFIGVLFF